MRVVVKCVVEEHAHSDLTCCGNVGMEIEGGDVDDRPVADEDEDSVELFDMSIGFELDLGK